MSNEDIQEIKASIRGVHERLNGISQQLSATSAVLSLHVETLQRHDSDLNGDAGLKVRVVKAEGAVGAIVWGCRALWGVLVSLALLVASKFIGE